MLTKKESIEHFQTWLEMQQAAANDADAASLAWAAWEEARERSFCYPEQQAPMVRVVCIPKDELAKVVKKAVRETLLLMKRS